MKVISDHKISIEHIMWQPTFKCVMKDTCKDCYVSKSSTVDNEVSTEILDRIFFNEKTIECEQFTISLDSLTEYPEELVKSLRKLWDHYNSADNCNCEKVTKKSINGESLPELCVTAFNVNTVNQWARTLGLSLEKFLKPLYILSLSNLPVQGKKCHEFQEICSSTKTILNYNKMCDSNTLDSKAFEMGVRYADQVYLVLKKNPLGNDQDKESVRNYIKAHSYLKTKYPKKLINDSCVIDSQKYLKTGSSCSAGISKLHIWPGDIVTACPYDSHKIQHNGNFKNSLMEEIKTAMNQENHCMNFCKIHKQL